ncbi:MAG: dihydroorotate dehydrogenase electron transfer subunit [Armatimonadota bacterium]
MSRQHQAEVISNTPLEASGHFVMILECPEVAGAARPGQFVHVRCSPYHDPLLRRPLSVAGVSDDQTRLSLLVREVGKGTAILARLAEGAKVDILGPLGNGYTLRVDKDDREFVLVAGGYGAAPIHFAARCLGQIRGRLEQPRLSVFLGAASADRLAFADGLSSTADDLHLVTEDGSVGDRGLVTDPLTAYLETAEVTRVMACGPTGMMAAVARICERQEIPCEVSLENWMGCGVGACLGCVVPVRPEGEAEGGARGQRYVRVCADGPVFDAHAIVWEAMP